MKEKQSVILLSGELWRETKWNIPCNSSGDGGRKKGRTGRQIVFAMWFTRVEAEAKRHFFRRSQTKGQEKKLYDCQRLRKLTLRCVHTAQCTTHICAPPFLSLFFYFDQNMISFPFNFDILTLVQSTAAAAIVAIDCKIRFMLVGRQSIY